MAFNGSGVFNLVTGNPVVSGTVISATVHNNTMSDIASNGLSNCITKDGQTTITQNIPFNSRRLTVLGTATALSDAIRLDQVQNSPTVNLTSVAGTNTITASISPIPSAYASGQVFYFAPANDNTGATTINISSLGAKDIFANGAALTGGELVQDRPVAIRYDGTQFEIISNSTLSDAAFLNRANTFTETQRIESDDAGAGAGPDLELYRNSATPADDDLIGRTVFIGEDDGGNETIYAALVGKILDVTDTEEDGQVNLYKMIAGTLTDFGKLMTDYVQAWENAQRSEVTTITAVSDTFTPNMNDSNWFDLVLDGSDTLANPTNLTAGQSGAIYITKTAGSDSLAYGTYWPADLDNFSSMTDSEVGVIYYSVISSTSIDAFAKFPVGP